MRHEAFTQPIAAPVTSSVVINPALRSPPVVRAAAILGRQYVSPAKDGLKRELEDLENSQPRLEKVQGH